MVNIKLKYNFVKHYVSLLSQSDIINISTDEDPSLRIERFATINLRGVSAKYILHISYVGI